MKRASTWSLAYALVPFLLAQAGCNAGGRKAGPGEPDVPVGGPAPGMQQSPPSGIDQPSTGELPGTMPAVDPALPTDTRPAVVAATTPPPISGGTLIISADGLTAVAADPDRDRISIVDLRTGGSVQHVALNDGDEPGRLALDAQGRVHAALRGSGEVATVDIASAEVVERRAVCGAPRGIAYDAAADVLHVACISGELVTLPAQGGEAMRRVNVAPDLRDVLVQDGRVLVTQFKEARLLELDASGEVATEHGPTAVKQVLQLGALDGSQESHPFEPVLARRAIALRNGDALVLHQRAMADEVEIGDPHEPGTMDEGEIVPPDQTGGEGGYGSGANCQSIVQSAVSMVSPDGKVLQSASLGGSVLPVDVAASPDGSLIAVANAGIHDPGAPLRGFGPNGGLMIPGMALPPGFGFAPGSVPFDPGFFSNSNMSGSISLVMTDSNTFHDSEDLGASCVPNTMPVPGQPTAVAFTSDGALVVQSREPAQLMILSANGSRVIALGGESRLDTGHEIFHRDAGGGIACASCHGEGGDDGHVWQFAGLGPRRTQAVNVGLRDTEPFHWSGDMADLNMLVGEVFVTRMGGVPQSAERIDALASWLFAQQPPVPIRSGDDPAVARGKELFHSEAAACGSCHTGDKLTNNDSVDVGTGEKFQVPSLVGIAYRAPFIHTGCAETLRDRFDPTCGGDKHGNVADLSDEQIGDLVAYLESL